MSTEEERLKRLLRILENTLSEIASMVLEMTQKANAANEHYKVTLSKKARERAN